MANRLGLIQTEHALLATANYTSDGITLAEFDRLAQSVNWTGTWYSGAAINSLGPSADSPITLHLTTDGGHFVLLRAYANDFALIEDPSAGLTVVSRASLSAVWSGYFYASAR